MLRRKDPAIQRTIVLHALLASYAALGLASVKFEEIEFHLNLIVNTLKEENPSKIGYRIFSGSDDRKDEIITVLESAERNFVFHIETINEEKRFVFDGGTYVRARRRIGSMMPHEEAEDFILAVTRELSKLPRCEARK